MRFINLLVSLFLICPFGFAGTEEEGGHGMAVFGTEKIYFSHLPMFHAEHRYQYIFEGTISKDGKEIKLKAIPRFYTIEPTEAFVLPEKLNALGSFTANLYDGHFEKAVGPLAKKEVAKGVTIQPTRLILAKQLRVKDRGPEKGEEYFLFGNEKEKFLAHLIHGKPSFDEILSVKTIDGELKNATLAGTVVSVSDRLTANKEVNALLDDFNSKPIKITTGRIEYPDQKELE